MQKIINNKNRKIIEKKKRIEIAEKFIEYNNIFIRNKIKLINLNERCIKNLKKTDNIEDASEVTETIIKININFIRASKGIIEKMKSLINLYEADDRGKEAMSLIMREYEVYINSVEILVEKLNDLQFTQKFGNNPSVDDMIRIINKDAQKD